MIRLRPLAFFLVLISSAAASSAAEKVDVFTSGDDGYHTYRIPALIETQKGTLLAFAEARKSGRGDSGNIDLVLKRSKDGGKTWLPMQLLWDDGDNTCGNPCPVVDESTGRIWLPLTWNHGSDREDAIKDRRGRDTRRVFISWSDDDGETWAEPKEITSRAKHPDWTWYATGPGIGIQLQHGPHKGRLVIPCDHNVLVGKESIRRSHCIYSDDHGVTWNMSEPLDDKTNECTVVELPDGRLLLNMRSYHGKNRRAISYSEDGGATWGSVELDDELIEPVCQGALLGLTNPAGEFLVLFSNPASTKRERMTVKTSRDNGKTWPGELVIEPGSAAYSCLTTMPGKTSVGLLYERDDYKKITFISLNVADLFSSNGDKSDP